MFQTHDKDADREGRLPGDYEQVLIEKIGVFMWYK